MKNKVKTISQSAIKKKLLKVLNAGTTYSLRGILKDVRAKLDWDSINKTTDTVADDLSFVIDGLIFNEAEKIYEKALEKNIGIKNFKQGNSLTVDEKRLIELTKLEELRLTDGITASDYLAITKEINKLQDLYAEEKIETDITINIVDYKDVDLKALEQGTYFYNKKKE